MDNIRGNFGVDKFQPNYFKPAPKTNMTDPFKPGFMKDFDPFGQDSIDFDPYKPPPGFKYGIRPRKYPLDQFMPVYGIRDRDRDDWGPRMMYGVHIVPDDKWKDMMPVYGIKLDPWDPIPIRYGIRANPLPPRAVTLYGFTPRG